MTKCLLCLRDGPTIKAHIMAEGLLKLVHHVEKPYDGRFIMVGTQMSKAINRPTGSYDRNILCAECDNKLGRYDKAAITFCKRTDLKPHPSGAAYTMKDVDTDQLRLFAISYAWRASRTQLNEYNLVSLGPKHEERMRLLLLNNIPGELGDYDLVIAKFHLPGDKKMWGMHVLNPVSTRFEKVNTVTMYLPNLYKFILKVDQQPFPPYFDAGRAGATPELLIFDQGDYRESKEFGVMHKSIMNSK